MTITPDDDRPVDPYAELLDEEDAVGEDAIDEGTPAERIDADDRPVPLIDEE
ncbi:MAG: hypothetical protein QOJ11_3144 [Frankiales bacterium]|jgi:hypothetical protein|nr:hypothetical protein [Frankiales bacterium]